jgi:hypothetical protein
VSFRTAQGSFGKISTVPAGTKGGHPVTKKKMLAGMAVSTVLLLGGVGATSASAASNKAGATVQAAKEHGQKGAAKKAAKAAEKAAKKAAKKAANKAAKRAAKRAAL